MAIDFDTESIKDISFKASNWFRHLQFSTKKQLAFLEDLYTLINDGIPANRAVEMMAQVTTGLTRDVALSIGQKISEGQGLAEGMREWFVPNVVEIIRVGEEGGALNETMRSAIKSMSERSSALTGLISALAYPMLVLLMACVVIVYLNNSVFVQFKSVKPVEQWPDAGRQLVHVAQFIQGWWWLALLGTTGIIVFLRVVLTNYVGEFRPLLDRLPLFSLYRRFAAARLMETVGLLVANGVVFKNAIRVMQYQTNPYLAYHLSLMEQLLASGRGNIADVLSTGLIDDADIMRLRVMAEVKGFEHGLIRMGIRGGEQGTVTLKIIARVIGGLVLLVGAILIIIIVKGIYLTGMSMGT